MTHVLAFQTLRPANGPEWLPGYDRSVVDLFRRMMPAPFTLHGYETADIPLAAEWSHSLIFDHDLGVVKYSNGSTWASLSTTTGTVTSVSVVTANGVSGSVATATTTPAITLTLGAITPSSVAATGNVTGFNLSGTNTGDQTTISGNAGSATILQTGRTLGITGDLVWTSPSFNGSANVTAAGTLATVNSNVGSFGSATQVGQFTVNAKGLVTAAANVTITPAFSSLTGTPTTLSGYGITDAQALDADLTTIAGLTATTDNFIVSVSSAWASRTPSQVRSTLGVTATGADTAYAFRANNLSDLASASAARVNLALGTMSTQDANAVAITAGTITGITDLTVADGGTGRSTSTTAYALLAAGTTATGAHQTLAAGATTEILVGGGASALPVWTTATGTGAPVRATSPTFGGTVTAFVTGSNTGIYVDDGARNIVITPSHGGIGGAFVGTISNSLLHIGTNYAAAIDISTAQAVSFPAIGTTASAANAFLDSGASNNLLRSTSSLRYKTDVKDLPTADAALLLKLRPVTYRSKSKADDPLKRHWGFIAEEAHEFLPQLVNYDAQGRPDWFQYERVVVGLLAIVKTQEARIIELEKPKKDKA